MSFIIIQRGQDLQIVPEDAFPREWTEEKLHHTLEREPRFIAVEREGEPLPTVVVASRLKLPSGDEADLLLLDSEGTFTLCELKKGGVTRKTVGQILDYAAQLAEMSEEEGLWEDIRQAREKLREQTKQLDEEWDDESLADEALSPKLQNSRLVLVGWRIEEDALRIARWLQQQGVAIECYAFDYFRWDDLEIFVPRNLTPMEEAGKEAEKKGGPSPPVHDRRMQFWEDMLRRLGHRIPHRRSPTKEKSLAFGVGHSDIWLEWDGGHSELRVRLVVRRKEELAPLLGKLREFLPTLNQETGEVWKLDETPKHFRIVATKDAGTDVWNAPDEVRSWGVETMVKLYEATVPRLQEWVEAEE